MNKAKKQGVARAIAFLLLATALILTVGFAANGKNASENEDAKNPDASGDGDLIKDPVADDSEGGGKEELPSFFDPLTGEVITREELGVGYLAFTFDSSSPIYGLSDAAILIEMPIENGGSRFLQYRRSDKLPGKIGTLCPTRDFITDISEYFGGALIYYGNDGMTHDEERTDGGFDLSENFGYSYTEYTHYNYTNGDLILAGLANLSIAKDGGVRIPFSFVGYKEDETIPADKAYKLSLPYSEQNLTELVYSKELKEYLIYKAGEPVKDLITGKTQSYKNGFILFSDSVTYETADDSELILDTAGGEGLYFTNGAYERILWSVDDSGKLVFTDDNGEILTVNRGKSYISFFKSSAKASVKIN